MRVFSITVPNPYVGEGSKSADRVAPLGQTMLSYFTVFAKDTEDARQLFVEFCGRNKRVPTGTEIVEIGTDTRVSNRVVVDQTPVVYDNVEVSTIDAGKAKDILRSFLKDNDDPLLAEAIRKVVQLDEYVAFKGLASTIKARKEPEVVEIPIEQLVDGQELADEVSDDVNSRLTFFERLTQKRGE